MTDKKEQKKTKEFESINQIFNFIGTEEKRITDEIRRHQSFIYAALGGMPKTPVELAKFIDKVIELRSASK